MEQRKRRESIQRWEAEEEHELAIQLADPIKLQHGNIACHKLIAQVRFALVSAQSLSQPAHILCFIMG